MMAKRITVMVREKQREGRETKQPDPKFGVPWTWGRQWGGGGGVEGGLTTTVIMIVMLTKTMTEKQPERVKKCLT